MRRLIRCVLSQRDAVVTDPVLRYYGVALALVNTVTAVYWLTEQPVSSLLGIENPPICWPIAPHCEAWRLSPEAAGWGVVFLGVLGLVNAAAFAVTPLASLGYWLLMGISVLKAILLFQDFRLILNQHYMANWVTFAFLFWPAKRPAISYLLVLMYFCAGLLKTNVGWLSGAALYGTRPLGMPAEWVPASCAYVLMLELVLVPAILSGRPWLRLVVLAQLALFHTASFWVVGFFYPILMYLLLTIFVFPFVKSLHQGAEGAPALAFLLRGRERVSTYAILAGFCVLQLVPSVLSKDPALTGEGRMFALHMFDAPIQCQGSIVVNNEGDSRNVVRVRPRQANIRIACDPILYLEMARDYCRKREVDQALADIGVELKSRRQGEFEFQTVVSIESFCASNPHYNVFGHNAWILR